METKLADYIMAAMDLDAELALEGRHNASLYDRGIPTYSDGSRFYSIDKGSTYGWPIEVLRRASRRTKTRLIELE